MWGTGAPKLPVWLSLSPRRGLKPQTSPRALAGGSAGARGAGGFRGAVALAVGLGGLREAQRVLAMLCGAQPTQWHCRLWLGWGLQEGLPAWASTAVGVLGAIRDVGTLACTRS